MVLVKVQCEIHHEFSRVSLLIFLVWLAFIFLKSKFYREFLRNSRMIAKIALKFLDRDATVKKFCSLNREKPKKVLLKVKKQVCDVQALLHQRICAFLLFLSLFSTESDSATLCTLLHET